MPGTLQQNLKIAQFLQVSNQELPEGEGPRAIPLLLDFTAADTYIIDLSQLEQQTKFSMLQTVFLDLSGTDNGLTLLVRGSGQTIKVKGRTQGYYPVLAPNPTIIEVSCPGGPLLPVALVNVPIFGMSWATQ